MNGVSLQVHPFGRSSDLEGTPNHSCTFLFSGRPDSVGEEVKVPRPVVPGKSSEKFSDSTKTTKVNKWYFFR